MPEFACTQFRLFLERPRYAGAASANSAWGTVPNLRQRQRHQSLWDFGRLSVQAACQTLSRTTTPFENLSGQGLTATAVGWGGLAGPLALHRGGDSGASLACQRCAGDRTWGAWPLCLIRYVGKRHVPCYGTTRGARLERKRLRSWRTARPRMSLHHPRRRRSPTKKCRTNCEARPCNPNQPYSPHRRETEERRPEQ